MTVATIRATTLIHIQASPVGGQWASDALIQGATDWARANNTRVQMHMLESPYQRDYAWRTWGRGFIEQLDSMGALGEWADPGAHGVERGRRPGALLAARGVCVAHNPSSNLRLRSGIAPIARYRQAGVNVGIGMDGHTLDDDQDYLREMRLAFTLGNQPGAGSAGPCAGRRVEDGHAIRRHRHLWPGCTARRAEAWLAGGPGICWTGGPYAAMRCQRTFRQTATCRSFCFGEPRGATCAT